MDQEKIGLFIKRKRIEKGLTQEQLAANLNVSPKTVSRWERGMNTPDISIIEILSIELGISVSELIQGEEIKKDNKDDSLLAIQYSKSQFEQQITKQKNFILKCLIFFLILLADISYGYFSTSLNWQIYDRMFFPNGIIATIFFGRDYFANEVGLHLTQLFYIFIIILMINIILVIVYVFLTLNQNRRK